MIPTTHLDGSLCSQACAGELGMGASIALQGGALDVGLLDLLAGLRVRERGRVVHHDLGAVKKGASIHHGWRRRDEVQVVLALEAFLKAQGGTQSALCEILQHRPHPKTAAAEPYEQRPWLPK